MTTGVICAPPILQFTLNNGQLAAGGSILTQVGGVNAPTFQDQPLAVPLPNPIPLNSRGEISNAAGASCQLFLTPNTVYVFTLFDGPNGTGNQIWAAAYVNGIQIALTQAGIGLVYRPQSAAEAAASITPTNYFYDWGDVRRLGAKCDSSTNDTVAINNTLLTNNYVWITGTCVASGIKMLSDGQVLTGVGRNSGIIALNNTTPCIIASANRQVIQNLLMGTGALATNDANFFTITAITKAASAVVTVNSGATSNPFAVGGYIFFTVVSGMTQINGQNGVITAIGGASGAWTATVNINSSGYSTYTSGGSANSSNFCAIQCANASRTLIQGITTSGVWAYGIDLENTLYTTVTYCNIDGFRKRAINIQGGGDNRAEFNMIFDSTLAAPTDAHVYMLGTPSIHINDNLITRSGASAGPAIFAYNSPGTFFGQLLWITDNTIDNGQSYAISVNGVWDTHISGNWCSWGQSSGNTGQIILANVNKFYVRDNDIYSSLNQGIGLFTINCSWGVISGNTQEYNYIGIQIDSSVGVLITDNISGQLTGLPPSGVPTQYSYVESNCVPTCQVYWINNIANSPAVAAYLGITNTVVTTAGYTNSGVVNKTANYTAQLTDRGGKISLDNGAAITLTIPANVFAKGDEIKVISSQATIANIVAPGAGMTLFWANGTNASGNRTLTGVGYATIEFLNSTFALITGTGVT